jgi:hypothetical protein
MGISADQFGHQSKMWIALDWDSTFTEDPWLWRRFISDALSRGHTVKIVTARDENMIDDIKSEMAEYNIECIATNGQPKIKYCGVPFSVWIDDSPSLLFSEAIE